MNNTFLSLAWFFYHLSYTSAIIFITLKCCGDDKIAYFFSLGQMIFLVIACVYASFNSLLQDKKFFCFLWILGGVLAFLIAFINVFIVIGPGMLK